MKVVGESHPWTAAEGRPFGMRFVLPLALGSSLAPVNSTMTATALAPIAHDFHARVAQTGGLIAGLYLTSSVARRTMACTRWPP